MNSPAFNTARSCANSGRILLFTSRSDDAHSSSVASIDAPIIHDLRIMVTHGVAGCTEHGARSRRALSSADAGQDRSWHQTLKNRILLENYYLPGDLETNIEKFVDHYNHRRYHESLSNLTPADVYFGRGQTILLERERIKRNTIQKRRLQHQKKAA